MMLLYAGQKVYSYFVSIDYAQIVCGLRELCAEVLRQLCAEQSVKSQYNRPPEVLLQKPRKSLAKASRPPGDASAQKCSRKSPTKASQKRCNSTVRTSLALRTTSRGHSYEKSTHGEPILRSCLLSGGFQRTQLRRIATSGEFQMTQPRRTGGKQEENSRRAGGEEGEHRWRTGTEQEENRRRTGGEQEENRRRTAEQEENKRRTGGEQENRRTTGGEQKRIRRRTRGVIGGI